MTISEKIADQIVGYINDNLDQSLDIHELSEKYHLSKFTLERIFKNSFGQTVHQFILHKRLEEAFRLLINTDLPIKEVISMVGFKSITSFTIRFHQIFQITPAALRDQE